MAMASPPAGRFGGGGLAAVPVTSARVLHAGADTLPALPGEVDGDTAATGDAGAGDATAVASFDVTTSLDNANI